MHDDLADQRELAVAALVHGLNNSLSIISGQLAIATRMVDSREMIDVLSAIETAAGQIRSVAEALSTFCRRAEGALAEQPLSDLIHRITNIWEVLFPGRVQTEFDPALESAAVECDAKTLISAMTVAASYLRSTAGSARFRCTAGAPSGDRNGTTVLIELGDANSGPKLNRSLVDLVRILCEPLAAGGVQIRLEDGSTGSASIVLSLGLSAEKAAFQMAAEQGTALIVSSHDYLVGVLSAFFATIGWRHRVVSGLDALTLQEDLYSEKVGLVVLDEHELGEASEQVIPALHRIAPDCALVLLAHHGNTAVSWPGAMRVVKRPFSLRMFSEAVRELAASRVGGSAVGST
ncbi:MAG: hypothetical protein HZB38_18030 [Planctomycetes bacterium]|nr:hypothetical protein [Planctomycetota bacterium]